MAQYKTKETARLDERTYEVALAVGYAHERRLKMLSLRAQGLTMSAVGRATGCADVTAILQLRTAEADVLRLAVRQGHLAALHSPWPVDPPARPRRLTRGRPPRPQPDSSASG